MVTRWVYTAADGGLVDTVVLLIPTGPNSATVEYLDARQYVGPDLFDARAKDQTLPQGKPKEFAEKNFSSDQTALFVAQMWPGPLFYRFLGIRKLLGFI